MSRRRKIWLGFAFAVIVLAYWPGPQLLLRYRIWHHEEQLRLAREEFRSGNVPPLSVTDRLLKFLSISRPHAWEREEIHRQKLVELGALEFHEFRLMHLKAGSGAHREGRHFMHTVMSSKAPSCEDATSVYPNRPEQLILKVWCKSGGIEAWRTFVAKYDVPNYWDIRDQSVTLPEPIAE